MTVIPPELTGGVLLGQDDKEIPISIGETLLAMTLAELAQEVVRLRAAVEALIEDPANPFTAADNARAALAARE